MCRQATVTHSAAVLVCVALLACERDPTLGLLGLRWALWGPFLCEQGPGTRSPSCGAVGHSFGVGSATLLLGPHPLVLRAVHFLHRCAWCRLWVPLYAAQVARAIAVAMGVVRPMVDAVVVCSLVSVRVPCSGIPRMPVIPPVVHVCPILFFVCPPRAVLKGRGGGGQDLHNANRNENFTRVLFASWSWDFSTSKVGGW